MFVPSLSWQMFGFWVYNGPKKPFCFFLPDQIDRPMVVVPSNIASM